MSHQKKSDSWVNDYLNSQNHESKPEKIITLDYLAELSRKAEIAKIELKERKISYKTRKKLLNTVKHYEKKLATYSSYGERLRPSFENATVHSVIRDARFRQFRK